MINSIAVTSKSPTRSRCWWVTHERPKKRCCCFLITQRCVGCCFRWWTVAKTDRLVRQSTVAIGSGVWQTVIQKIGQSKIPNSNNLVTLYNDINGTLLIQNFKSFNQFVAQFPPITFLGYSSSLRGRRTFCSCRTTLGFFGKRQVLCCHPLHTV